MNANVNLFCSYSKFSILLLYYLSIIPNRNEHVLPSFEIGFKNITQTI